MNCRLLGLFMEQSKSLSTKYCQHKERNLLFELFCTVSSCPLVCFVIHQALFDVLHSFVYISKGSYFIRINKTF